LELDAFVSDEPGSTTGISEGRSRRRVGDGGLSNALLEEDEQTESAMQLEAGVLLDEASMEAAIDALLQAMEDGEFLV
jgi:hypothetical protein